MKAVESFLENLLVGSRWLLAPIFAGLIGALVMVVYKFYQAFLHTFHDLHDSTEEGFIISVLTLVDVAMLATLVVMVIISGYENSVSKLDVSASPKEISWLGKVDASGLKLKIATSIIAISSIHLLKEYLSKDFTGDAAWVQMAGHLTFVVSAFLLAGMDRFSGKHH